VVQDDKSKAHSLNKELEFVSKGTEVSLRKFVLQNFTSLTLDVQSGVVSIEDTTEIWETVKEDVIEKVREKRIGQQGQIHLWWTKGRWRSPSDSEDQTTG
jgi:hypothetical protein